MEVNKRVNRKFSIRSERRFFLELNQRDEFERLISLMIFFAWCGSDLRCGVLGATEERILVRISLRIQVDYHHKKVSDRLGVYMALCQARKVRNFVKLVTYES